MTDVLKGENQYPHINHSYVDEDALRELQGDLETWFTQGMQAKFFYMQTWMQNINFHAGNQWLKYDEHKRSFEFEPQLDDEIRLTINKVLPAVRMAVGKLLQDRKRPLVLHRSQDEDAISTAKVATQALEHFYRVNDGIKIEKEVLTWSTLCGKGVTKQWYDAEREIVVTDVLSTFELVVPPNVLKMDKMPWGCHARFETRRWVWEQYGIEIEGTSDWGQYGMFLSAVKNIMEDGGYTGIMTNGMEDNVLVKDWWIRPCKRFPKGLLVIEANNEIIYADKNPFSGDDKEFFWPFAELDFFDAPYRYWPISLVENMVDINKWINEFYSQNLENVQYANAPIWWAQEGTVDPDQVEIKPGVVNTYNGSQAPQETLPRGIDPVNFQQVDRFDQSIGELSGIHFFGPGSLPPGVHAAAALAIINEQDQMASMSVSVNHETWLKKTAEKTLYLMRKWGPNKMMIRVMGEENQWEVKEFERDFLNGDEEVHVESKQELAQDKMTKFDQILKLMTTLGDDQKPIIDTETGLRLLELAKDVGLVTPRSLNRNMQMDENQKLWKGDRVEVYEWEDHKVHIEGLMEQMLTIKFKQADPKVREAYMDHFRQHQSFMNAAQEQNQTSSQVTQSAPQQPGVPGIPPQMMQPGLAGGTGMPLGAQQGPMMPGMSPNTATGIAGGLQAGMQQALATAHLGG